MRVRNVLASGLVSTVVQAIFVFSAFAQNSVESHRPAIPYVVQLPDSLRHMYEGDLSSGEDCRVSNLPAQKNWPFLKNARAVFLRKFPCVGPQTAGSMTLAEYYVAGRRFYARVDENPKLQELLEGLPNSNSASAEDSLVALELSKSLSAQDFEELLRHHDWIRDVGAHLFIQGAHHNGPYAPLVSAHFGITVGGKKPVKSVTFRYVGLNALGEPVSDGITPALKQFRVEGPIQPGKSAIFLHENAWASQMVLNIRVLSMSIEFADGSKKTLSHPRIPTLTGDQRLCLEAFGAPRF